MSQQTKVIEKSNTGTLVCPATVYCRIWSDTSSEPILDVTSHAIRLKNESRTKNEFEFSFVFPKASTCKDIFKHIGDSTLSLLLDGYNSSILSHGSKTLVGFEPLKGETRKTNSHPSSTLANYPFTNYILSELFDRLGDTSSSNWRIGVSFCDISSANDVLHDLLLKEATPSPSEQGFGTEILQHLVTQHVLSFASAAHACTSAIKKRCMLGSFGYFFQRIVAYNSTTHQVSSIHIVELAGYDPVDRNNAENTLAEILDMLLETSVMHNSPKTHALDDPQSSSLVLHRIIAPLLAGNSKTFFVANVLDSISAMDEALRTLELAAKAQQLQCVCARIRNVTFSELGMAPSSLDSTEWLQAFSKKRKKLVATSTAAKDASLTYASDAAVFNQSAVELRLERAHLPRQAPTEPIVDGLDKDTATSIRVAEAALLRKSYDALLEVLKEQDRDYQQLKQELVSAKFLYLEKSTESEVKIDTLTLENMTLTRRLKHVEQDSFAATFFEQYEDDIRRLEREVERLRNENISLMLKEGRDENNQDSKKRLQKLLRDFEDLRNELRIQRSRNRMLDEEQTDGRIRKNLLNEKLMQTSSRKLNVLNQQVQEMDDELLNSRLGKAKLAALRDEMVHEKQELQRQRDHLKTQYDSTVEELVALKMYLSTVQKETRKGKVLDSFLRKQYPSTAAAASRHLTTTTTTTMQQNDEMHSVVELAKEALAKARCSSPKLVPVLEKLDCQLKLCFCRLTDYELREKDYIHVLQALSEETPSLSLRDQIQSEMATLM